MHHQAQVKCSNPSTSQINGFEVYSTSASKKWLWNHDVMAKRTMMEVWKVKKKGSSSGEGNHKTEGSPAVDIVRGVVIAMQRMHIELYVYETSPMELVGVHPTCLLMKT